MAKRRLLLWAAVLTTALFGLSVVGGCAPRATDDGDRFERTLVIATVQEPSTLDPAAVYDGSDRVTRQVYEQLLQYRGATTELEPMLATDWSSDEKEQVFTFKLRQGVKFHDGTVFNAEAVKFSFDRMVALKKGMSWAFQGLIGPDSIRVVDEYTVEFNLLRPYPPFPHMVASRYAAPIVSPSLMQHEKDGDWGHAWANENAIGTGPYMLKQWVRKERVELGKNPDYWGGWRDNSIHDIVIQFVPEPATQRLMLERGDIHIATHITVDDITDLRKNPDIRIVDAPEGESNFNFFLVMHTRKGVFQDKRLREALSWAFPYEQTVDNVFHGQVSQSMGPIPAGVPGHNPDVFVYHRDINRARQLMAEAGYPNGGFSVEVTYMMGQYYMMRLYDVLVSTLAELGISAVGVPLTWSALVDRLANYDTAPDICIGDWWPDYADPYNYLGGMALTFLWTGSAEDSPYCDQEVVDLFNAGEFDADLVRREESIKRIQDLIVEDIPAVWAIDVLYSTPMRKNVYGFVFNPYWLMTHNVYDMWIERQ